MKTLTGETLKKVLLFAVLLIIATVSYFLHTHPAAGAPAENFVRHGGTNPGLKDSIKLSRIQASIDKDLDSLERNPPQEWLETYSTNFGFQPKQNTSLVAKSSDDRAQYHKERAGVLKGPSAFFSRRYSLRVGKPVPVSILWAPDSSSSPVKLELVTITLTGVADDKAGFTMADASAVLLYSGTQYAVNDNISIEDKDHNLHISVLQVNADSVKIEFTSNLTDGIVSRLKGWD